jgi:hypothetical protein
VKLDAPVCVSVSAVGNALRAFTPGGSEALGLALGVPLGTEVGGDVGDDEGSGMGVVVVGVSAHAASAQQTTAKNNFVMARE